MPVSSITMLKRDSLRLLHSLTGCLSNRFIFDIGYREKSLSKFNQAVKKQPMKTVN
jgi:hypothetical protein